MAQKVRKAVIPAAGLGTRVLPISKAMPKEMLPIVDKPAIQYIVEEAVKSGIEDILIITNRGKGIIEDHFDHAVELEERLEASGRTEVLNEVRSIAHMANIYFVRQKETRGLGHAVNCARSFIGNEPFAVLYGDDVIIGEDPACGQLCRAYEAYGKGVVGIKQVTPEQILKYSSLKVSHIDGNLFHVTDMIEKPSPDKVLSLYSILGRCVLPPEIFSILDNTPPGAGRGNPADGRHAHADPPRRHDRRGFHRKAVRHGQQAGDPGGYLRGWLCSTLKWAKASALI